MNIVELMMAEHAGLRVHLRYIREKNSDSVYEIEDFVRNCHARIEDELIFPKLRQLIEPKDPQLVKVLSRLEADHKLIEMIGEQIKVQTAQGEPETLRKRIMLYASTLETHNATEETTIFPFWSENSPAESEEIVSRARKIVEAFGRDRYFRITGVSEKLFDSVV